jgi:hypothetical protein
MAWTAKAAAVAKHFQAPRTANSKKKVLLWAMPKNLSIPMRFVTNTAYCVYTGLDCAGVSYVFLYVYISVNSTYLLHCA